MSEEGSGEGSGEGGTVPEMNRSSSKGSEAMPEMREASDMISEQSDVSEP